KLCCQPAGDFQSVGGGHARADKCDRQPVFVLDVSLDKEDGCAVGKFFQSGGVVLVSTNDDANVVLLQEIGLPLQCDGVALAFAQSAKGSFGQAAGSGEIDIAGADQIRGVSELFEETS